MHIITWIIAMTCIGLALVGLALLYAQDIKRKGMPIDIKNPPL